MCGPEKIGNGKRAPIGTKEGGVAMWLINKTGLPSVKGTVLDASLTDDLAVGIEGVGDIDPFCIMYSDGIDDGLPVLVVFSGIAEVLFDDGIAVARGGWAGTSDITAGRAQFNISPPATAKHDQELGHILESKDAGVNVLVKTLLHYR